MRRAWRAYEYWKGEAKQNLVGYFSQTTVHGFRYIVQGRNLFERVIWILFILFGFVYSFYTIWKAIIYWETHPVETTIDQVGVPVQELPFPAITICDTQSLQMPRRNQWMFLETLLNSLDIIDPQQLVDGMTPGTWNWIFWNITYIEIWFYFIVSYS